MTNLTQGGVFLRLMKKAGSKGVENWELSRHALKYTSVISELRKDGYSILAERQKLSNGRASNTWRYVLVEEHKPLRKFLGFKRA